MGIIAEGFYIIFGNADIINFVLGFTVVVTIVATVQEIRNYL